MHACSFLDHNQLLRNSFNFLILNYKSYCILKVGFDLNTIVKNNKIFEISHENKKFIYNIFEIKILICSKNLKIFTTIFTDFILN